MQQLTSWYGAIVDLIAFVKQLEIRQLSKTCSDFCCMGTAKHPYFSKEVWDFIAPGIF